MTGTHLWASQLPPVDPYGTHFSPSGQSCMNGSHWSTSYTSYSGTKPGDVSVSLASLLRSVSSVPPVSLLEDVEVVEPSPPDSPSADASPDSCGGPQAMTNNASATVALRFMAQCTLRVVRSPAGPCLARRTARTKSPARPHTGRLRGRRRTTACSRPS